MTDKDIQVIREIAESKLAKGITTEEALRSLQRAGHLDENGDFTPTFQHLAKYFQIDKNKITQCLCTMHSTI